MHDNHIEIPGPEGKLVAKQFIPHDMPAKGIFIVSHPHPLHGGTMNNKVVTTLARLGRELGLISITFNFRGVGGSEGVYAQGLGEQDDLRAVITWAKAQTPHLPIWLGGFSFGAYVSAAVATQEAPACLISICPPVDRFDFVIASPCTHITPHPPSAPTPAREEGHAISPGGYPWYIVQTEDDEVVDAKAVIAWAKTLKPQPTLITLPTGGHFFHGQLLTLRDKLSTVLLSQFTHLCPVTS